MRWANWSRPSPSRLATAGFWDWSSSGRATLVSPLYWLEDFEALVHHGLALHAALVVQGDDLLGVDHRTPALAIMAMAPDSTPLCS